MLDSNILSMKDDKKLQYGDTLMYSKHFSIGRKSSSDQNLQNTTATEQKCRTQKQKIACMDIFSSFWYPLSTYQPIIHISTLQITKKIIQSIVFTTTVRVKKTRQPARVDNFAKY